MVPFYACQFVSDFQIVLQKLRVLWQQKRILTLCDIQKGPQRFQWETTYVLSKRDHIMDKLILTRGQKRRETKNFFLQINDLQHVLCKLEFFESNVGL